MFDAEDLQAVWYAGKPPSLAQRALATLYSGLTALRRTLYRYGILRTQRLPVPVVVVGNITVGGTGKTPLVIALVEALRARGCKPGVVSRGYGGTIETARILDHDSKPGECGDEPVLIHRATGAAVAVGRDRVAAAHLLLAVGECDLIIADDGLQHYALARDVEICVIDGTRRFGNGRLLPAGPLREPLSRLQSIPFLVCNGGVAQGEIQMTLVADSALPVGRPDDAPRLLADFAGLRVHAVAGIGNPSRFFTMLRGAGLVVDEHPFADHHAFTPADFDFGDEAPVLMTQKDAVKCENFARANFWQVPVHAMLPDRFFEQIHARLFNSSRTPIMTNEGMPANDVSGGKVATAHENGHFYSPVVDPAQIDVSRVWPDSVDIVGIDFDDAGHERILRDVLPAYLAEYDYPEELPEIPDLNRFYTRNSQFSWLDSRALFALVREWRPARIIEVGSGFSTLLFSDINTRFLGSAAKITCIEPYPREFLKKGLPGIADVVERKVQDVPLAMFDELDAGDILFIDSSHVVKTDSDVVHLFLVVLPRLKKGVRIHVHDIFLPHDYPKEWVLEENRSWNEQYLLRGMLTFARDLRVTFGCSYAFWRYPDLVRAALSHRNGHAFGGGSFWFEKV